LYPLKLEIKNNLNFILKKLSREDREIEDIIDSNTIDNWSSEKESSGHIRDTKIDKSRKSQDYWGPQ